MILGGGGDDTLSAQICVHTLDGGAGTDTLTYAGLLALLYVDLKTGHAINGDGGEDTLISIEACSFSPGGSTVLGSAGDDWRPATSIPRSSSETFWTGWRETTL